MPVPMELLEETIRLPNVASRASARAQRLCAGL